ncbi:uncharacterized protein [Periplaneta americana]|uniref:uncharacterized protein isoform X2 n=1 Tax=Periplaneta americana TaxID=6978 RepID=UPI0037E8ED30
MKRSVRYGARSQVQTTPRYGARSQVQTTPVNNAVRHNTPAGAGHRLGDGYANRGARQRAVQEVRSQLQMKYDREAEEAAEKKRLKEQKKREAWLARQEAITRPGHVLGYGNRVQQNNPLRDLVYHNDYDGADNEAGSEPQWVQQHLQALVENRIERERDAVQMERRLAEPRHTENTPTYYVRPGQGVVPRGGHVTSVNNNTNMQGPANQTAEFFLGTGYGASASSNNNARANQTSTVNHGHILGSSNNSVMPPAPNAQVRDKEVDHREQMRAARLRLQQQYNVQAEQAARKNEQEEKVAEKLKETSLN